MAGAEGAEAAEAEEGDGGTEVPPPEIDLGPEVDAALDALRADDFAARAKATATLEALSVEDADLLRGLLRSSGDDDPEFRQRLGAVIENIYDRQAREEFESGRQVALSFPDGVKPEAVLEALDALTSTQPLTSVRAGDIWDDPEVQPFEYEGDYWGAVDHLFDVFPPTAAEEPGREDLTTTNALRYGEFDLAGVGQVHAAAGVMRVRAARTAIEHSNGRDFFAVTLVPKVEPDYIPTEIALLIRGFHFADGSVIEPETKICRYEPPSYRHDSDYSPSTTFTWAEAITEDVDRSAPVKIDALMQIKARRLRWHECALPGVNGAVSLTQEITLAVEEKNEDSIKVKFTGSGTPRIDLRPYDRTGPRYLFAMQDEEGGEVEFQVRGSSSGGGSDSWHQSFTCHLEGDGDPVHLRVLLPGEELTARQDLSLEHVPLPGMGAPPAGGGG